MQSKKDKVKHKRSKMQIRLCKRLAKRIAVKCKARLERSASASARAAGKAKTIDDDDMMNLNVVVCFLSPSECKSKDRRGTRYDDDNTQAVKAQKSSLTRVFQKMRENDNGKRETRNQKRNHQNPW